MDLMLLYFPDHMKIIKEGPVERRRFIDIILSQVADIITICSVFKNS